MREGTKSGRWLTGLGVVLALGGVVAGKACLHGGRAASDAISNLPQHLDEVAATADDLGRSSDVVNTARPRSRMGGPVVKATRESLEETEKEIATEVGQTAFEDCVKALDLSEIDANGRPKDDSSCGLQTTR
jgi:hypothetical protein